MKKLLLVACAVMLVVTLAVVGCDKQQQVPQSLYQSNACVVFNSTQEEAINLACYNASNKYNVKILVFTCLYDANTNRAAYTSAEEIMRYYDITSTEDHCVIVLSYDQVNSNYHFYLDTTGEANIAVTDQEINQIVYSSYADQVVGSTDTSVIAEGIKGLIDLFGKAYQQNLTASAND